MIRHFCLLLICYTLPFELAAADANWSLRTWQADDGLPDNDVTGIAQSAEGYLWVATHAGLARFDGLRFEPWTLPVGAGISNSMVRVLGLGLDGQLWAGLETMGGLMVGLSDRATNVFTAAEGVPQSKPQDIAPTLGGSIWAGYSDGAICRFSKETLTRFGPRDGLPVGPGGWLTTDKDNRLWFAKAGRVGFFDGEKFQVKFSVPGQVIRLGRVRAGGIWILADKRLMKSDGVSEPLFVAELPAQRASVEPTFVYEDRTGGVWLGTKVMGLHYWDGQQLVRVETSHSDVAAIMEDREGNIWVGTEGGGLDRLRHRILELNSFATGLTFEAARSVCVDEAAGIWVVGTDGALARNQNGRWLTVTNGEGWSGALATCVANDRQGGVWVGTFGGQLLHWQGGKFSLLRRADGLAGNAVRALFMDSRQDLWIGLENSNCLQRLRAGKLQTFLQPDNSRSIRSIVEDAAGKIWLATSSGFLLRVEGDQLLDETSRALQPTKPIRALDVSADGGLWIGYAGAGVGWLRNGKFSRFGIEQGLLDNNICDIESEAAGALWFTSGHGMFQVRAREFEEVANGRASGVLAVDFGRNEGLLNLQGSYGYWPTTARGADGRLWFATRSGLVAARPARVQPNRVPPMVMIERVLVDGQPKSLPGASGWVRLPPTHRKLELEFTALNFAAPESVQLQHRLEGWDDAWSEPKLERNVVLPRLPAGRYEFQVAARNAAGVWNRTGATLRFEVEPFLWQRWWFQLAAVLGFTGVVVAIVRYASYRRLRQRLLRLEQETALQRDRARIAHDLHDDLGANLTQIALLSELAQNDFEKPAAARGHLDRR